MKTTLRKSFITLAACAAVATSVQASATEKPDVRVPENRVIYELFVRNFSSTANFKGVEEQVDRLADLGIDIVWLMPIYSPGLTDRWGPYASPYAVRDYKGIDPSYGTADDLHSLIAKIHGAGMEVWFDWVANHTSTDHVWLTEHPDFYTGNGTPVHPNGWSDVYELDYNNPAMREAMIDALKYWVEEFDIDGYRCDHTDGVPRDFWAQAREAVDAVKPIGWLAESGGGGSNALQMNTFDYNYAWGYNTALLEVGSKSDVNTIATQSANLHYGSDAHYYEGKSRMVYLSNHDVVQDQNGTEDRHFGRNLKPMTVLYFTVYGMPLIYNGQEVQYSSGQVLLSQKTPIRWNTGHEDMTELFKALTHLKHTEPALRTGAENGEFITHSASHADVYVYERRRDNHSVIVMLNFGTDEATFNVTSALPDNLYTETFTGAEVNIGNPGSFTLPAHGYAVYTKELDEVLNVTEAGCTIFVDDITGWPALSLYGWASGQNELFGKWPGYTATETENIDGTEWKLFPVGTEFVGRTYNLIFSNSGATQLADYAAVLSGDIFLRVSTSGVERVQAGIEAVEADQAEAEYYDIYGRRLKVLPSSGLYIERRGTTVRKVLR